MKKFIPLFVFALFLFVPVANASFGPLATTGDLQDIQNQLNGIQDQVTILHHQIGGKLGSIVINPTVLTTSTVAASLPNPIVLNGANTTTLSGIGSSTFGGSVVVNGSNTSTITGDDTASFIPNFNTMHHFPTPAALANGAKCGASTGITDPGTCLNAFYAADDTVQSTTAVTFPYGTYTTAVPVVFNTQSHLVYLFGQPGAGTVWNYTSTTASNAMTFNDCNSNNKRPAVQMQHMAFTGATTTAGGPTAIFAGGTNGGCLTKLDDIFITSFTTALHTGSGTYMFAFTNSEVQSVAQALWIGPASNSGEHMYFDNDTWGNPVSSASATQYVFLDVNGVSSADFHANSFDCGGVQISTGNLSVTFDGDNHWENPCNTQVAYNYLDVLSSTNTVVNIYGGTAMNDATTTIASPGGGAFYFNCGATCSSYGLQFNRNGSATTTVLGWGNTLSASNARITACNSNLSTVPFTVAVVRGGGTVLLQNNGCLYGMGGNFLQGWNFNPGNNQMTVYGGASGPDLTIAGNLGGAGTGVSNCFSGNAQTCVGTSTIEVQGTFGGRSIIFSATTTAAGTEGAAQGALTWVFNGGASTTFTLPTIASTLGRIINVINRGTAPFTMAPTSTDFIAIGDTTTTLYTVTRGQSVTLQNDSLRWSMISHDPQRYVTAVSIGGASLSAGACTSTTTGVDAWIATSTSNSRTFPTSPTIFPGTGATWYTYLSGAGTVTTEVCEPVIGTPTASSYNFTVN